MSAKAYLKDIERCESMEQRSPEWRASRIGRITGSRMAAVVGVHPYSSTRSILEEMAGEMLTGEGAEVFQNDDMRRGVDAEESIIELWLNSETAIDIEQDECDYYTALLCREGAKVEIPMGYSPDAVYKTGNRRVLVETKCPRKVSEGGIPKHYEMQMQLGIHMTGSDMGCYVEGVYNPDGVLEMVKNIELDRDDEFLDRHFSQLEGYMEVLRLRVERQADEKPPSEGTADQVAAAAEAAGRYWEVLRRELAAKAEHKALADELAEAKRELVERCEAAGLDQADGLTVSMKRRTGTVDTKRMAADGIDVEAYRGNPSEYWVVTPDKKRLGELDGGF